MNKVLNVGCGASVDRHPNVVNLDAYEYPGMDVVHDLDITPWPFEDGTFSRVQGIQVFEHLHNPVGFMTESYRVLKQGGVLYLAVPHWQSENSFTDPTHVRHCTERTFDYWIAGRPLNLQFGPAYGGVAFSSGVVERWGEDIRATLTK